MDPTPQKVSLVAQTRSILIEGMCTGRWRDALPGQRRLCHDLRISRWTLRSALEAISHDGLLAIQQGCACKILPRARRARAGAKRPLRVALLVPQPLSRLRHFVLLWVNDLRLMLRDAGIEFTVIDSAAAYRARPARALRRLVDTNPHDTWVLMLNSRAMQGWFQQEMVPAVITGSGGEGIALPALDIDHHAAGVHAGHVLLRLGHRRIGYLVPPAAPPGVLACERGLRAALKAEPHGEAELSLLVGDTREEIGRAIDRSLKGAAPTALVCAKAFSALTALTFLSARGRRVPLDLSLICIEPEPFFAHLVPTVAHYTLSPELFAKRLVRLISERLNGTVNAGTHYLELSYVAGESVGKVGNVSG